MLLWLGLRSSYLTVNSVYCSINISSIFQWKRSLTDIIVQLLAWIVWVEPNVEIRSFNPFRSKCKREEKQAEIQWLQVRGTERPGNLHQEWTQCLHFVSVHSTYKDSPKNTQNCKISNLSKALDHLAENGSKNQMIIGDYNTSLNTELDYVDYSQNPHRASR